MISFLIEQGIWDEELALIQELRSKNVPFYVHPYADFDPGFAPNDPITFCYGSLEWISQIQKYGNKNLKTIYSSENYNCHVYYKHYQQSMFNNHGITLSAKAFLKDIDFLLEDFGGQFFMRPSSGAKPHGLSGSVVAFKDQELLKIIEQLNLDEKLFISMVKPIQFEWRSIATKQTCISGCQYRTYDEQTKMLGFDPSPSFPQKVRSFVENFVGTNNWFPDDIFVIDVVESNNELYVMEINALSTSGWYDCNYGDIIDSINQQLTQLPSQDE